MCMCVRVHTWGGCRKWREVSSLLPSRLLFGDLALQEFVHPAFWKRSHLLCLAAEHGLSSHSTMSTTLASETFANSFVSAIHYLIWIRLLSFCAL